MQIGRDGAAIGQGLAQPHRKYKHSFAPRRKTLLSKMAVRALVRLGPRPAAAGLLSRLKAG
jgi:hypothetical protein